ncbi:dihydroorotate dehydrogenase electron transfer subunit [Ruminiclostridium sufflavum DSM 19573]|uniref:Dihydroorotate dehydrogenase electron transfer subunit n=1 Tax=Ruminiclostridium sufflavum DSM 19573 TaxID=1121337 RepID=A0A318XR69_9FIRM|nr:dihydroorotate dehydrogenase electron transfer subunit [Ruminiclostridium sufflavum]PYG89916.1 dihydroorotate dehydrogenase electron transfer subunit [Ruminiclostridium sufflavum DSM 19573]
MSKLLKEQISDMQMLCEDVYRMKIKSEYVSLNAKPGQFVNIRCGGIDALLRRPISICDVDRENNTFDIVFQIKGKGTEKLCHKCAGEVDIMAPLGNPFSLDDKYKSICVVGGGIGTFPLLYLLKSSTASEKTALMGFRSESAVVLEEQFKAAANTVEVVTDDGTYGKKAFVTELLEQRILEQKPDIVYTCGPAPMMRKVAAIAEKSDIACQVSMEQRMGCGIGACLVCACKTKKGGNDDWGFSHVCKDGPVFWSTDVCWE